MNLVFQTETGGRYDVNPAHLSAENTFSFMHDGSIFIYYNAGDCDIALPYVDLEVRNADYWTDVLQPEYGAYVNASNPVYAVRTQDTVEIVVKDVADRRARAAQVNARKRAIERAPWTDTDGRAMRVRLQLVSKSYSETYNFLHSSRFTYKIERTYVGEWSPTQTPR